MIPSFAPQAASVVDTVPDGFVYTSTTTSSVFEQPSLSVTVTVYVVADAGLTEWLAPAPSPLSHEYKYPPAPPAPAAVIVVELPKQIETSLPALTVGNAVFERISVPKSTGQSPPSQRAKTL